MVTRREALFGSLQATLGAVGFGRLADVRESVGSERPHVLASNGASDLRHAYDLADEVTYLNHAAIGTMPRIVREAQNRYGKVCESNPWLYVWGKGWEAVFEDVRAGVARYLNCASDEIAFVRNTTEGFNLMASRLTLKAGEEVLYSTLNHVGAAKCWEYNQDVRGFSVRQFRFPVERISALSEKSLLDIYEQEIRPETRVLVFPGIDYVFGIRHPLQAMARMARKNGVEFVAVDGAQSVGMIPVDLSESEVDFYATSSHKWLQAPKGSGLLYVRKTSQSQLPPWCVTWGARAWAGSARKYEDYGTRDYATILSLVDAISFQREVSPSNRADRYAEFRALSQRRITGSNILQWKSPEKWALGSTLFGIGVGDLSGTKLFEFLFREFGFVFRPIVWEGSDHLRVSPNLLNSVDEIQKFFDKLEEAILSDARRFR